jgi:putative DNA primase/helicase
MLPESFDKAVAVARQAASQVALDAPEVDEVTGPDGFLYSDLGNANRLMAAHGEHLRFVPRWRRWMAYDGKRWVLDHADTIVAHLAADIGRRLLTREMFAVIDTERDPKVRQRKRNLLVQWVTRSESRHGVLGTVAAAASVPGLAIDHEALDADPWLLNVRNGTLDLRTGTLRPHDPLDLLSMTANVHYDPTATAPMFEAFLAEVLPDHEVRQFVQRLFGVVLVGAQIEHVLPIALGGGANGKSTLTRIVAELLGEYAVVASVDLLLAAKHDTHPTGKASLFRKRLAHSGELPPGAKVDEAQVKRLTGGDEISARRMREDEWSFSPSHTLFVHANHRPAIDGTDNGIWRRVLLIPFTVQVPPERQDSTLPDRIIATEAAGVLNWLLDGLAEYRQMRLAAPEAVRVATDGYRRSSDTVAAFLADVGVIFDPVSSITANDLMAAHGEWFRTSGTVGHGSEMAHYQLVTAELKRRGAANKRSRSRGGMFWQGVTLDGA